MECGFDKDQLTRLLHGELPEEDRVRVEAHLAGCPECRQEWEAHRRLWALMDEIPVPAASADARVRFDAMLDTYKASVGTNEASGAFGTAGKRWGPGITALLRQVFAGHPAFAVSYSFLLVIAGLGVGYLLHRPEPVAPAGSDSKQLAALTAQVGEMREMMMKTLLQNPSASERMRGISYTSEIKTVNKEVIEALLSTLNNDPNTNVRLMTLEALTHYADNPVVREGLVQSILQQDSPLVQAALADVMLRLQEKRAIRPLKKLLQHKDLNEMVKTRIEETISRLS
ncbi:zf-HC2 domain-containing protein [Puia dinghuensis]|uniref:Putative zinc-finger domain-containing protein n=1 Tax=Puia dinghuensis TaxID=1792502 RepID=A0A8J2XV73_9BACT|nr:zf-HC2 domain-containing protein [Puia dinghuensis]GGB10590.1 hypothetical protein GCM10011511_37720 [Puia dinghuensis]